MPTTDTASRSWSGAASTDPGASRRRWRLGPLRGRLPQPVPLQLAGGRAGQLVEELHAAWVLVGRDLPLDVILDGGRQLVLVLNAGNGTGAPLSDTTDEDWQRMLDLNLTAPFRCLRRALPHMIEDGWGRVVVIASIASRIGEKQIAAYTASKHGVLGLVRSAAAEVASTGVTVNAVCPGYVDTPMTDQSVADIAGRSTRSEAEVRRLLERKQPIKRLVTTEEVADVVALCVANGAINAQGINVDGGAVQS